MSQLNTGLIANLVDPLTVFTFDRNGFPPAKLSVQKASVPGSLTFIPRIPTAPSITGRPSNLFYLIKRMIIYKVANKKNLSILM